MNMGATIKTTQKFRVWYRTQYGIGIDEKRAGTAEAVKLSKMQRLNLIEIELLS